VNIAQEIGSKPHECHFFVQHGQTIYESVSRNQRHLQSLPNQCSHEGLRCPQGHLHCSFPAEVELRSPHLSDTEASISNYLRAASISVLVSVGSRSLVLLHASSPNRHRTSLQTVLGSLQGCSLLGSYAPSRLSAEKPSWQAFPACNVAR